MHDPVRNACLVQFRVALNSGSPAAGPTLFLGKGVPKLRFCWWRPRVDPAFVADPIICCDTPNCLAAKGPMVLEGTTASKLAFTYGLVVLTLGQFG